MAQDIGATMVENGTFSLDSLPVLELKEIDSVQVQISSKLDSLHRMSNGALLLTDSINPDLVRQSQRLDSVRTRLSSKIDSLNRLQLPTGTYTKLLDSINQIGGKPVAAVNNTVKQAQDNLSGLQKKVNAPVTKVERTVNDKLALMNKEGGSGANIPGAIDVPGVDSPNLSNGGELLPGAGPGIELPDGERPHLSNGLGGEAAFLPDLKTGLPEMKELDEVTQGIGEIQGIAGEVSAYGNDLKNMGTGNFDEVKQVPQALESEATKLGNTEMLAEKSAELNSMKELAASGNDKEALKKQALQHAPKLASNHFKGQQEVLQQAIGKMNSYKEKYTELTDLENIPKRNPNQMRDKPLVERLVPGLTLQIQKSDNVWLDYNISMGYRITGRLTSGIGWNERIGIAKGFTFTTSDRVYGPRTYIDFRIKKGFSLYASVEQMNTYVPPNALHPAPPTELDAREWVWGIFTGIKKEYDFVKSVKGNFEILYNLYDDHGKSPYTHRINVRFGFLFPLKK